MGTIHRVAKSRTRLSDLAHTPWGGPLKCATLRNMWNRDHGDVCWSLPSGLWTPQDQSDQHWGLRGGRDLVSKIGYFFFFSFIFLSRRLITSQHCSGFCHTLTWTSHGVTCVPHPDSPFHLPLHPIPLGLPSAPGQALVSRIPPGLVICFTINNIHAVLSKHPTLAFSHRV